MEGMSKVESKVIKKKLNAILANFDNCSRYQLRIRLENIARFCYPYQHKIKSTNNL